MCAVEVAGAAVFAWNGALGSWPGWVGLAVAAGSWAGLVRLAVVAHGAGDLVDEALERRQGRGRSPSTASIRTRPGTAGGGW